ncbi:Tn3 family transposase [Streptomyces sp. NPDC001401]|uniref:Tn3 family transposase n=1 Tax=Streptomyces sp. NPDC001401 TaxID=3364570 RepID=UPI003691F5F2
MDEAALERVGQDAAEGWLTLPPWEMASVAMLNHAAVRAELGDRRVRLLEAVRSVQEASDHDFKCLYYALLVLDDEPMGVLHRPTGTGYALRMSGLGDNFQLHTLLADVLVGGGHVPVTPRPPRRRRCAATRPGRRRPPVPSISWARTASGCGTRELPRTSRSLTAYGCSSSTRRRRMIGKQLNIAEARHRLARRIFFGQRGELRQH